MFVPLVIVFEADEGMCDRFGKTLDLGFQSTYQSLLLSPSAVAQLLPQMSHREILLLRLCHDSRS